MNYLKKRSTRFQLTRYCIRNCLASARNCLLPFTVKIKEEKLSFQIDKKYSLPNTVFEVKHACLMSKSEHLLELRIKKIRCSLFSNACFFHLLLTKTQNGHCCNR